MSNPAPSLPGLVSSQAGKRSGMDDRKTHDRAHTVTHRAKEALRNDYNNLQGTD